MISSRVKKLKIICSLLILVTFAMMLLGGVSVSSAQSAEELQVTPMGPATDAGRFSNPHLVRTFLDEEGREIDEVIVPGRPPEKKAAVARVPEPNLATGTNILSYVPAFDWSYGCSATAAAMLFGYYDNTGYPNMYTGPTNGGVCPMDNSVWGQTSWPSIVCGECPLSATNQGVDGRTTKGHVDDYWVDFDSTAPDPFIGNWPEHSHVDCTGDFMGTNQSNLDNRDGNTTFFYYANGDPLYDYTGEEGDRRDGCHGLRLFAESRGYSVQHDGTNYENFNQYIYGYGPDPTKGFTFAQYKAEIDAGRPVLIQVIGHTMLGYGYNTAEQVVYIHDTWDQGAHQMTWGGTYGVENLRHYGVTVIHLSSVAAPNNPPSMLSNPSPPNHATGVDVNTDLSWMGGDPDAGDTVTYDVYFGTSASPSQVVSDQPATSYDPGPLSYDTTYYWKIIAEDNHEAATSGPTWDFTTQVSVDIAWNCPLGSQALIAPYPGAGRPFLSMPADCGGITASAGAALWGIYYLVETGPGAGRWLWYIPGFVASTLTQLEPDKYYWVVVSAPCTLLIPQV